MPHLLLCRREAYSKGSVQGSSRCVSAAQARAARGPGTGGPHLSFLPVLREATVALTSAAPRVTLRKTAQARSLPPTAHRGHPTPSQSAGKQLH